MDSNELSIKIDKVIAGLASSEIGSYVDTGLRHKIYQKQMDGYLAFMKKHINPS